MFLNVATFGVTKISRKMVCQLIPATMQLRDSKTNARCDISGTVTELSNVKWNDKKVKQNVIF
jgi:hypothetical protein